jgi:hypothetical protein
MGVVRGAAALCTCVVLVACGLQLGGTLEADDLLGSDASVVDSPSAKSEPDANTTGVTPGRGGDSAQPSDAGKADAEAGPQPNTSVCNGAPIPDCAQCPNKPVKCVFCATAGATPSTFVRCSDAGTRCRDALPPDGGYATCPCNSEADPSPCPMPYQVCNEYAAGARECRTCGEPFTAPHKCKSGLTCDGQVCK